MNNLKNKNILELLDCLNDALSDILFRLNLDLLDESDSKKEEKLSELILKSLDVIDLIERHFDEILDFDVKLVNSKIKVLINTISLTFIFSKEFDKNNFSEKEKQLYQVLINNLHNLSIISLEFEKKHKIGLTTLDKATFKKGLSLLEEGIDLMFEELERNFPDVRKS